MSSGRCTKLFPPLIILDFLTLYHEPPQKIAVESLVFLFLFFKNILQQHLSKICGEKRQQQQKMKQNYGFAKAAKLSNAGCVDAKLE